MYICSNRICLLLLLMACSQIYCVYPMETPAHDNAPAEFNIELKKESSSDTGLQGTVCTILSHYTEGRLWGTQELTSSIPQKDVAAKKMPTAPELSKSLLALGGRIEKFTQETTLVQELAQQELSVDAISTKVQIALDDFYNKSKSILGTPRDRRLLFAKEDYCLVLAALFDEDQLRAFDKTIDYAAKEEMHNAVTHYVRRRSFCMHCELLATRIDVLFSKIKDPESMNRHEALETLIALTKTVCATDEMRLTPISAELLNNGAYSPMTSFENDILPILKSKSCIVQACTDIIVKTQLSAQDTEPRLSAVSPKLVIFIVNELRKKK